CPTRRSAELALHQAIGILGANRKVEIREARVINRRDDGAGHVLQSLHAVEGRIWLHADGAKAGMKFLETPHGANERSAGSETGNEMGEAAARLLPDLDGGGL